MKTNPTIDLACQLIQRASVTPEDAGCQTLIAERLQPKGFTVKHLPIEEVDNLWVTHGNSEPLFVFAGHTDVVPAGNEANWKHPPFSANIENNLLYGRGAADMKGSVAAMITAMEEFVENHPNHPGTIALLLTSDEEGPAINGIRAVMQQFQQENIHIDYCLLGEPSSSDRVGDVIKVGRRGSLSGCLTIFGKEGHIAYPHLADNPNHKLGKVINALSEHQWDKGNAYFPPTSLQISNVHAGDGTTNVIPAQAKVHFNLRFSTELDENKIMATTKQILDSLKVDYEIEWLFNGSPFLTEGGKLINATEKVIKSLTGLATELSTSGGTSDGRFIAPTGTQVVELGPVNATIHKDNEHVDVQQLILLQQMYQEICRQVLLD